MCCKRRRQRDRLLLFLSLPLSPALIKAIFFPAQKGKETGQVRTEPYKANRATDFRPQIQPQMLGNRTRVAMMQYRIWLISNLLTSKAKRTQRPLKKKNPAFSPSKQTEGHRRPICPLAGKAKLGFEWGGGCACVQSVGGFLASFIENHARRGVAASLEPKASCCFMPALRRGLATPTGDRGAACPPATSSPPLYPP